jgi:hypothetical protein
MIATIVKCAVLGLAFGVVLGYAAEPATYPGA